MIKKFYRIYEGDRLVVKGFAKKIQCYMGWGRCALTNHSRFDNNNIYQGYRIEWEQVDTKKKNEPPKKEDPYDCIVRHLKQYGNTSLIKSELPLLDRLQKEFDIEVKHYKKGKDDAYGVCWDREDWVITLKN